MSVPSSQSMAMPWPPPQGEPARRPDGRAPRGRWPRSPTRPPPADNARARIDVGEEARVVERFLDVHAVGQHVDQHLGMAHGLIVGAHDAERHDHLAVPPHHAGDDRVHRPLARPDAVRVAGLGGEAGAPVVQHDAGFGTGDADAEGIVDRVDERDRRAVLVDHGQIDRVGVTRTDRRRDVRDGPAHVDAAGELVGQRVGQHVLDRHVGEARVGDMAVAQFEGEPRRLGLQVMALDAVRRMGRKVEALQDVEHDQRGDALAGGRDLHQLVALKLGRDRLDIVGLVSAKSSSVRRLPRLCR